MTSSMFNEVRNNIETNNVRYKNFYYAYCKKDPKNLNFSEALKWDEIEQALKDIFHKQLVIIVKSKINQINFIGEYNGKIQEIDKKIKPATLSDSENLPAINILQTLTEDSDIDLDEFRHKCDILALKYLSHPSSQTSVYGLLTFELTVLGNVLDFVFVTLCDLDEKQINARIDEDKKKLITEIMTNVFQEKKLTKGVLYPLVYEDKIMNEKVLLFDKNHVQYWADAFECKKRLTAESEKEGFTRLVVNYLGVGKKIPQETWNKLDNELSSSVYKEIDMNTFKSIVSKLGYDADSHKLEQDWVDRFGDKKYALSLDNVYSDKAEYTVHVGEVKVRVKSTNLKNIQQFEHNGEVYVVIRSSERAKIGGANVQIEEITWDKFKAEIDKK